MVPTRLSPWKCPSTERSRSSRSHCGGIEKLSFPSTKRYRDTGRALPPPPTKRPTSILVPDLMTSNQDGTGRPFIYTVRSQRPSNAAVSDTPDAEQVTTMQPLNAIVKNQLFMTQNFIKRYTNSTPSGDFSKGWQPPLSTCG